MLLKKVDPAWAPSESRDLKVGETVEITDYRRLVESGAAVIVDEQGNEIPLPDQVFLCPICYAKTRSLVEFTTHVGIKHSYKTQETPVPTTTSVVKEETALSSQEVTRQKRLVALEKARAARQAKKSN